MERLLDTYAPRARQEDLVIEGLGGETLVYDMRTHKAHCLNHTAALVWSRCDGRATVGEMAKVLESELSMPVRAEVVWLALEQLGKAQLLVSNLPKTMSHRALSRRDVIRRVGVGAIALPLVASILAPTAEATVTCIAHNSTCTQGGTPCCDAAPCNCTGMICLCG
ncbi:MAG TPA: PqqD family protein [Blastocatellia bacterium]|nr:PqqD family protein [Blastocatellia bacterium]